jgi:hypothetical protein
MALRSLGYDSQRSEDKMRNQTLFNKPRKVGLNEVYLTLKSRGNSGNMIESQRFEYCCHKPKLFHIASQLMAMT